MNLLEVLLVCTCCLMELRQVVLSEAKWLLTASSWSWLSRRLAKYRSSCFVSGRFQQWTSRLTGFCLDGTRFVSTKMVSWSSKCGIGIQRLIRGGRFVIMTFKVFGPRVGKSITCSPNMSKAIFSMYLGRFEVRIMDKSRQVWEKDWSQHVEYIQVPNGTKPGVPMSIEVDMKMLSMEVELICMVLLIGNALDRHDKITQISITSDPNHWTWVFLWQGTDTWAKPIGVLRLSTRRAI